MKEILIRKLKKRISLMIGRGPKYLIYYSLKGKLMWYMIPKAGSRTIRCHIEQQYPDFVFVGEIPVVPFLWRGYTTFTVIKDDEDRYNSTWRDKVVNRKVWSNEEFQKKMGIDPHLTPCSRLYCAGFCDYIVDIGNLS